MYYIAGVTILLAIVLTALPLIYTKCGEWNTQECDPENPNEKPKVNIGVLAGFLVAAFTVLVLAVVIVLQQNLIDKQKERSRLIFLARVVEAMNIQPSPNMVLSSKALKKEVECIDTNEDGFISKEELWKWISTGKIGAIDEKDFNILFNVMDIDGNGMIDFSEFFQFIANSGDEMATVVAAIQRSSSQDYGEKMSQAAKKLARSSRLSSSTLEP
jgi:hypothetical protein